MTRPRLVLVLLLAVAALVAMWLGQDARGPGGIDRSDGLQSDHLDQDRTLHVEGLAPGRWKARVIHHARPWKDAAVASLDVVAGATTEVELALDIPRRPPRSPSV